MRRFMPQHSNNLRGIDGRFSGRNACCFADETIYTSSPDFLGAAAKTCALLWVHVVFGTVDLASVYRQLDPAEEAPMAMQRHFLGVFFNLSHVLADRCLEADLQVGFRDSLPVICFPDSREVHAGASSVPESVMASFLERQTQIFPLEALAVLQRFFGLPETPILFVDNQAVCAGQSYERLWGCFGPGGILPFALGCSQCSSVDRDDNPSDGLSHAGLPDPWTILQPWQVLQYPLASTSSSYPPDPPDDDGRETAAYGIVSHEVQSIRLSTAVGCLNRSLALRLTAGRPATVMRSAEQLDEALVALELRSAGPKPVHGTAGEDEGIQGGNLLYDCRLDSESTAAELRQLLRERRTPPSLDPDFTSFFVGQEELTDATSLRQLTEGRQGTSLEITAVHDGGSRVRRKLKERVRRFDQWSLNRAGAGCEQVEEELGSDLAKLHAWNDRVIDELDELRLRDLVALMRQIDARTTRVLTLSNGNFSVPNAFVFDWDRNLVLVGCY
ncbi:unnamed protein product [Symbiodinium microadriaticum]|nr:unnamed protein product [Symbiodinium microadriaticum]CAE7902168.1 unnamed protein product [Symbiodinium sp. KB8]